MSFKDTQNQPLKTNKTVFMDKGAIPKHKKERPWNETAEILKHVPNKVVNENLDEVLEKCKLIDVQCDYEKCKKKTTLMGQDCKYCQKRYCFKHGLPEIHGCGGAVKRDERKQFLAPVPLKTIRKQQELDKAKKELQNKLMEMNQARKQKQHFPKKKQQNSVVNSK